jgi:hypothetical protein
VTKVVSDRNHFYPSEGLKQNERYRHSSLKLLDRVAEIAHSVFDVLREIVLFPTRYFGSKYWSLKSGYHFISEKTLTSEELKGYMQYAYANASANNAKFDPLKKMGYNPISPSEISISSVEGLEIHGDYFFDSNSGLKVILFEKEDEVILSFGALDSSKNVVSDLEEYKTLKRKGIKCGISNLLGGVPSRYSQAESFVNELRNSKRLSGKNLTLSGNCIGGSIATYVALKQKIPAVCINPLAVGPGLQREIGDNRISLADQYITNISIQSDWASDPMLLKTIDRIVSLTGIRTPGIFGHRYDVPTHFGWDFFSTHTRVLASLKQHLAKNSPELAYNVGKCQKRTDKYFN